MQVTTRVLGEASNTCSYKSAWYFHHVGYSGEGTEGSATELMLIFVRCMLDRLCPCANLCG